jgi:hypothetical protein
MYCPSPQGIFACHVECGETHDFGAMTSSLYASLVAAARENDVHSVLASAPHVSDFVSFNAARRSIQILSCSRTELISSLRVEGAELLAAAAYLERGGSGIRAASTTLTGQHHHQ